MWTRLRRLIDDYDNNCWCDDVFKSRSMAGGAAGFRPGQPGAHQDLEKLKYSTAPIMSTA